MYSAQLPNPLQNLTSARMDRIKATLRELTETTLEDYIVQIYSRVNAVLNIDGKMQPIYTIPAETPAAVGDITGNLTLLGQDVTDILSVLTDTENTAAQLYNLAAGTQNQILQDIRETFYASSPKSYIEPFINDTNISDSTTSLDFGPAQATLQESSATQITPASLTAGPNSTAGAAITVSTSTATDGSTLQQVTFNGSSLELIVTFAAVTPINRIKIDLSDYEGLELDTLTSTPDGSIYSDILGDLGAESLTLNATSGKLSGVIALDFPPRYVSRMRIMLNNRTGAAAVNLDSITFWQRQFAATSALTSKLITTPLGSLKFSADEDTWGAFTSIEHQYSTDGVHYTDITPGATVTISQPFYYRATLQRVNSAFSSSSSAVSQDPAQNGNFTLNSSTSVNIGNNKIQRKLVFGSVSGPITIQDTIIPGTFQVSQGSAVISEDQYEFNDNVLILPYGSANMTVTYQTSTIGATSVSGLQNFYTPVLREARFDAN